MKLNTLLFFFLILLFTPPLSGQSSIGLYLSKLTLPNDSIKHSNEAVLLQYGSDSSFYFSQKSAHAHRVAEFHLFLSQKKLVQEIKIPFPKELQPDRLLFVDNENRTMFFTCTTNGDDIYYSKFISGRWQKPMPFPAVNSPFRESGMCISPDKKKIVFASSRKNQGSANLDLYLVEYQEDGIWKKPQLLETISSDQDEDDPRFSPDGKSLFFASKGFNSLGKYDLFRSNYDETARTWSVPVNLGPSINSANNEIAPTCNSKGEVAFFSSDRFTKVGDFEIYRPVREKKVPFSIVVNDADSSLRIGNLQIQFKPEDAAKGEGMVDMRSETGDYSDSVYLNRWYTMRIMNGEEIVATERIRLNPTSALSKAYYFDLAKIKDPYLVYQGKRIPLLTKYVFRYDGDEQLPLKNNQKTLERVAELLGHLHIYQVEIIYPSNLPKDQQTVVTSRVDKLQKYLLKNKASENDITTSKQPSGEVDQLTLKMEFKLKIH